MFRSSPHQEHQEPARKSLLANPGSLVVAAFGLVFVGYVFNVRGLQKGLDAYFGGLNHAAQGHSQQVASVFTAGLPLIAAGMLVLIAMAVLRALGPSKTSLAKMQAQEVRGIEACVKVASEQGVSPKVARVAYRLLLPHVRKAKRLGIEDTLCKDLKVRPELVSDLYGTLLRHTDRRRTSGDDATELQTVRDLMLAVEASENKSAPKPAVVALQAAAAAAKATPVGVPEAEAAAIEKPKAKKGNAVLVHPARLSRRELSMIRNRRARKAE